MLERAQVLIVDDNRQMQILVRSILRAFGLRKTYEAQDPSEAFELLRTNQIDLVITDMAMRPLDGIEFATMVRRAPDSPNPYVPLIMMTGHAERGRVAAARDAGVTSFLVKPISARSLIDHVIGSINDRRPFVRARGYFGPDRRKSQDPTYQGPKRRANDHIDEEIDLD